MIKIKQGGGSTEQTLGLLELTRLWREPDQIFIERMGEVISEQSLNKTSEKQVKN